ncbi:hypothetical protein JTE90_001869 [Oedothorax gibbosus]|uniref:Uncharacterized protein n=1 Tax=Oedothorax gibbosus TaxID=931172 RepID=A0AAV6VQM3_9ARAC|nr:hypothetical protein JTE90_001869 [Oedothorax gibbosus]
MLLTSGSLAERIWSRSLFSGRTVMESENESRPLLRTVTRRTKRSICKRIPYEVAITGVIIGCFLTVVTVLLLLENLKSTENSKESLTIDRNLLGFPLNYNGKASFKSKQNRDPGESITVDDNTLNAGSKWMDEWREAYNVENFGDSLTKRVEDEREFTAYLMSSKDVPKNKLLLRNELETLKNKDQKMNKNKWEGLRNKGNKTNEQSVEVDNRNNEKVSIKSVKNFEEYLMKRLDEDENILDSWKKLQYSSKNPVTEKEFVENFLDSPTSIGGTDINLVGSPFKYNKKALDVSWQNKKEFTDYIKEFNSKWKDWTKTSDADIFAPFLKSLEQKSDPGKKLIGISF